MPKTSGKSNEQPPSITGSFPNDTPEETVLVEIAGSMSEAVTAVLRLSNDGRLSSSAQAAFWSLGQTALLTSIRIDDLWYQILAASRLTELKTYQTIAEAAAKSCVTAKSSPTPNSVLLAFEALGAANDALVGLLDRSAV